MKPSLSLPIWILSATAVLPAQSLIKDINTTQDQSASNPRKYHVLQNGQTAIFAARTRSGNRLFSTDGTTAGTQLLNSAAMGFTIEDSANLGNQAIFAIADTSRGVELWASDGTPAGTSVLKDINPGLASSNPSDFVTLRNRLYFTATDATGIPTLWETNGTPAGTISTSAPGISVASVVGSKIVGFGDAGSLGHELLVSDGTAAGTQLLMDLNPGSGGSVENVAYSNGTFSIFDTFDRGQPIWGVWVTDGTTTGTTLLLQGHTLGNATPFGNGMLLGITNDTIGRELWFTDGTAAGTRLVKDINPGAGTGILSKIALLGNKAYFRASEGGPFELWESDGTTAGTKKLSGTVPTQSFSSEFATVGSLVYYVALDTTRGLELWQTDGTAAGTMIAHDLVPGLGNSLPTALTPLGSRLLYTATTPATLEEPFTVQPGQVPVLVKDIGEGRKNSSNPQPACVLDNGVTLISATQDSNSNLELFQSDGTPAGTSLVKEIRTGPSRSIFNPRDFFVYRGRAYFSADDGTEGQELWTSDGTTSGTQAFAQFVTGRSGSFPSGFQVAGDRLFFNVTGPPRCFVTDGTPGGTTLFLSNSISRFAQIGSLYYFASGDGLWSTDGTSAGTTRILSTGSSSSTILGSLGSRILFRGTDPTFGDELWISDGTPAGTRLVKDVEPGTRGSEINEYFLLGSRGVFTARTTAHGKELWATDGTSAGTVLLRDIWPGNTSGVGIDFVQADSLLYFAANDSQTGDELWRTDGTPAGTFLVKEFLSGPLSGLANQSMIPAGEGSKIFLCGIDGAGFQPWLSDGTPAGTVRLPDFQPNAPHTVAPAYPLLAGDKILFQAYTLNHGIELYGVDLKTLGAGVSSPYGYGCTGTGMLRPQLAGVGAPNIGSTTYKIRLSDGRPSATCGIAIGTERAQLPLGANCSFWINAPLVVAFSRTDSTGRVELSAPVPPQPALVGSSVFMTGFVADPNGEFNNLLSFANGLHIVIGS